MRVRAHTRILKRLEAMAVQESEGEEAAEQRVTLAEDLGRGNLAARQSRVRLQEARDPGPYSHQGTPHTDCCATENGRRKCRRVLLSRGHSASVLNLFMLELFSWAFVAAAVASPDLSFALNSLHACMSQIGLRMELEVI